MGLHGTIGNDDFSATMFCLRKLMPCNVDARINYYHSMVIENCDICCVIMFLFSYRRPDG